MTVSPEKNGKFPSPPSAPSLKKRNTGARMTKRQASFAVPLMSFAVFPPGSATERMAESSTIPAIESRYPLKTAPPKNR